MSASEVRIGCSKEVRSKLHEFKGPARTYDDALRALLESAESSHNDEEF
jgi:hypothetical protein